MLRFSSTLFILITLSIMYSVSAHSTQELEKSGLIVYLSRTNNTEAIAEIIRDEVGGDMVELEMETPFPEDYDTIFIDTRLQAMAQTGSDENYNMSSIQPKGNEVSGGNITGTVWVNMIVESDDN